MSDRSFLDLLYDEAPRREFDALLEARLGDGDEPGDRVRHEYDVALRLRELIARQRAREAELSALYQTASDLTGIRDVDAILAAIVRRARQLLQADMTYLSLNEEAEGVSYMRVTEGALHSDFRRLRLPLGTGLLGLVAQTGEPYFTEDYAADERFRHEGWLDDAVAGEQIRAILGVPLVVDGRVIGTLAATHRTVRPFPPEEVSLLTSFAAHAAVALENARLFAELDEAHRRLRQHTRAVEEAAQVHDRLTHLLLHGSTLAEVVEVLASVLGGPVGVRDVDGRHLAGAEHVPAGADLTAVTGEATSTGRSVEVPGGWAAPAMAGPEHLATVVVQGCAGLDGSGRRTLERGAMVAALVLLLARSADETEERLGGALLTDLLAGREQDLARVRQRARRHALAPGPGSVLAVADPGGLDRHAARRVAAALARRQGGLAGERDGHVVLLTTGHGAEPLAVGERLRRALEDARSGAGDPVTVGVVAGPRDALAGGVPAAYAEARQCLDSLLVLGRRGTTADPAALGVSRLLLGTSGPAELASFVDRTLGPVLRHDTERGTALEETLHAWFEAGGRLRPAAEALHVHVNTVSQRLARVDELLGGGWRAPGAALDLQLALRVHRLRRLADSG